MENGELPTGTRSYLSTRDGNFEVYRMDADGTNLKYLTCKKAPDFGSAWSPDDKSQKRRITCLETGKLKL